MSHIFAHATNILKAETDRLNDNKNTSNNNTDSHVISTGRTINYMCIIMLLNILS